MVLLTIGVVAGLWAIPTVQRHMMISRLTSPDPQLREQARRYLIARAEKDEDLTEQAIEQLTHADEQAFEEIAAALSRLGVWEYPRVPEGPFLKRLGILSSSTRPATRAYVAEELRRLPELADRTATREMVNRLRSDEDIEVRYSALLAAVVLSQAATEAPEYIDAVAGLTRDEEPWLARKAWIAYGLLAPSGTGTSAIVSDDQPPEVAQATVWAALHSNPHQARVGIEAIENPGMHPSVKATAAWMLGRTDQPEATEYLAAMIERGPRAINAHNALPIVTALRFVPVRREVDADPGRRAILSFLGKVSPRDHEDPIRNRAIAVALFRLPEADALLRGVAQSDLRQAIDQHWSYRLAQIEGLEPNTRSIPFDTISAPYARIAAASVARNVGPQELAPAVFTGEAPLRDLACLVASERLGPDQNTRLVEEGLRSMVVNQSKAAAILAGVTDLRPTIEVGGERKDLLRYHEDALFQQDQWRRKQVMRLGLYMQGREAELEPQLRGLIMRGDVPVSTILLAMLHRGDRTALDYLLTPGQPERELPLLGLLPPDALKSGPTEDRAAGETLDLREFLVGRFPWYLILKRYLPEDAPRLTFWTDQRLQYFQIDVLRMWYLIHQRTVKPQYHPHLPPAPNAR